MCGGEGRPSGYTHRDNPYTKAYRQITTFVLLGYGELLAKLGAAIKTAKNRMNRLAQESGPVHGLTHVDSDWCPGKKPAGPPALCTRVRVLLLGALGRCGRSAHCVYTHIVCS